MCQFTFQTLQQVASLENEIFQTTDDQQFAQSCSACQDCLKDEDMTAQKTRMKVGKRLALEACSCPSTFALLPDELRNHKGLVFEALKRCVVNTLATGHVLQYVSPHLLHDREFALRAVHIDGRSFEYLSDECQRDREIVMTAVKTCAQALELADISFRSDKEIVRTAAHSDVTALFYAADHLTKDKQLILEAVNRDGNALEYAAQELHNDRDVVRAALRTNGYALQYVTNPLLLKQLSSDRQLMLEAVRNCGVALSYVSIELRDDREMVLEAVRNYPDAIKYASDKLQRDDEIMALSKLKKVSREITLSTEEIDHLTRAFQKLDVDGDGQISIEELSVLLKENNMQFVKRYIDLLDQDGDGYLDLEEFSGFVLQRSNIQAVKNKQLMFRLIDTNEDGYITFTEYLDAMKRIDPEQYPDDDEDTIEDLHLEFDYLDIDGNGKITFTEFSQLEVN